MKTFGQRLKAFRKNKNLTQEQLAKTLSVSTQAVSKWERDATNPDLSLIAPICSALDVTPDQLLLTASAERRRELQNKFVEAHVEAQDHEAALQCAEEALKELPLHPAWLWRQAYCELRLFKELPEGSEKMRLGYLAEMHLRKLHEQRKDEKAVTDHLVEILYLKGKRAEARTIAENVKDEDFRNYCLKICLEGEEKEKLHKRIVYQTALKLRDELCDWGTDEAFDFAISFTNLLYPEESIIHHMYKDTIFRNLALKKVSAKDYERGAKALEQCIYHCVKEWELIKSYPENTDTLNAETFLSPDIDLKTYREYGCAAEFELSIFNAPEFEEFRETVFYKETLDAYRKMTERI